MNTAKKTWIIIGSIVAGLALICFLSGVAMKYIFKYDIISQRSIVMHGINNIDEYNNLGNLSNYNFEEIPNTLDLSNTKKIDMEIRYGTINIRKGDEFSVNASNVVSEFYEVRTDGETLEIDYQEDFNLYKNWDTKNQSPTFTITVPDNVSLDELEIITGAIVLNIDDLIANDVDIECGAGDVEINNASFNGFELKSGASDIFFHGKLTGKSKISGGVGSTELKIQGDSAEYAIKGTMGVGNLSIGNQQYGGLGKNIDFNSSSPNSIHIDSGVGDITIDFVK